MIDYDELKKAAECQKENMLGPVSMVVGCDTILALLAEHEGQEQRIAELEAEVASLREDAERYAFIRAGKVDIVEMRGWIAIGTGDSDWCAYSDAEFDAAIDAARGVK